MARVVVDNMRKLGLDVEQNAMTWDAYSDIVWYERDNWQMTAWRMVGRPERMDPDEFVVNLFSSSTAESGYNFVGYMNPEYDALAQQQRAETDREQRRQTIFQAQELIARDVPYIYIAHPELPQLVRTDVWDEAPTVDTFTQCIYWRGTVLTDPEDGYFTRLIFLVSVFPSAVRR